MEFSLRYPPVRGRLHTRYAPVRRSSAQYCYRLLPLDLHVLSLPLAFILSQDQTLHCKNCFFTFDSSSCRTHIYICMPTHAISFFSSVSNNCRFFQHPVFEAKADAKVQPFSKLPKYFFKKNRPICGTRCQSALPAKKKFCRHAFRGHAKGGEWVKNNKKRHQSGKNGKNIEKTHLTRYKTTTIHATTDAGAEQLSTIWPSPAAELEPALAGTLLYLFYGCSTVVLQLFFSG